MRIPTYQVDAFTNRVFHGNPAAVCPLAEWLPTELLQKLAAENNLAETVFFVKEAEGYRIRWFTPLLEIDLCGHATVAAAYVAYNCLGYSEPALTFASKSGPLTVTRDEDRYVLDFPARPPEPMAIDEALVHALGTWPQSMGKSRDTLVVFATQEEVQSLQPNFFQMEQTSHFATIATAPGKDCDFVSRFFAPKAGINEDPVTGSAHCTLIPYWAKRLGKSKMFARQISARGGELWVEDCGERVKMGGQAVLYLTGFAEV